MASFARWALWLLLLGWLAIACFWGGLHFLIVPRIGELRPWVEQQATRALGVSVQIGNIVARSNGLIPSVELLDVRLMDAQGRESLRLPSVLAALSPRSAIGLGFEQLYIEGATLDIRRAADGRISVAGFVLPQTTSEDTSGVDWLFSQAELAVRHGVIRWSDELRGAPPLELTDVDVVLRNRRFDHALRFDANPPSGWGTRFTLIGVFAQPLLSTRNGDWHNWSGQLYAKADQIDFSHLRPYADFGVEIKEGAGALQAWLSLNKMQVVDATADVSLTAVNARVAPDLPSLEFAHVTGRLGLRELDGGREYRTEALSVETRDGLRWPGGNLRLSLWGGDGAGAAGGRVPLPQRGELAADRLDLAALAEIAQRLPLGDAAHSWLRDLSPRGDVESVQLGWQGSMEQPTGITAKGRVNQLGVAAVNAPGRWVPGIRGANVDFDVAQTGGRATLAMHQGGLELPGIFEQPQWAFDELSGDVQWKTTGDVIAVEVNRLKFANADAAGEAQAKWQTGDGRSGNARFPGQLDLQGSLSRGEATAVWRYLPLAMDAQIREYLHQALLGGRATAAKFRVKGDLAKFPFVDAKQGEFRVSATVQNATYAYAPAVVLPRDSAPWPVLEQVQGELLIDHETLSVKGARGAFVGLPGLQFSRADAQITKLYDTPVVSVSAEAKGPLTGALALVNTSPLGGWLDKALARASGTGNLDHRIKLSIPLDATEKTTVMGSVVFGGNDLQISASTPRLGRIRGTLNYTENGFSVSGMQARALGGDARVDGGLGLALAPATGAAAARAQPTTLRVQGMASAEGLRQARELGMLATLGNYAVGQTSYTASLSLRPGGLDLLVNSPLTGMAINLPAPLGKTAEQPLPLRFENAPLKAQGGTNVRPQDSLQLELGRVVQASYVRDISTDTPRVLSGSIGVGLAPGESAPSVTEGVAANLNLGQVDADAWLDIANALGASPLAGSPPARGAATATVDQSYIPTQVALRAREFTLDGRKMANLLVGASRDGTLWRANVQAAELSGYLEYRPSTGTTPGRVYARLSRLALGQSGAQDVESLLDQQPTSIPALDVVVEDMELRGKKLGRVELLAVNQGASGAREWRLNRFNITTPEATLTANGNWVALNAQSAGTGASANRNVRERRRTVLNFKLDISDAGDLLRRFGMDGVVAKGKGKVDGQVAWLGSPLSPDYPSMGGGFNVNVENGQFLKADPGIAKLLGVLSLQSLPRRLTLDFRDVFSEGFAFDFFRGDVAIEQGIARTNNLQMKGVNAAVLMEGQADIARETQLIKVVVIPEINAGSASLLTAAINPLVGLTSFLAQVILRRPLIEANTQELLVDGTWSEPRVTKVERK